MAPAKHAGSPSPRAALQHLHGQVVPCPVLRAPGAQNKIGEYPKLADNRNVSGADLKGHSETYAR